MPCTERSQPRMTSPLPGRSILMTSAPMSASRWVAKGPAAACSKASTRTPLSAGSATGRFFGRLLRLRKMVPPRRVRPLPYHHAARVLHDDGAILLDAAAAKLHDAPLRPRLRFSLL